MISTGWLILDSTAEALRLRLENYAGGMEAL